MDDLPANLMAQTLSSRLGSWRWSGMAFQLASGDLESIHRCLDSYSSADVAEFSSAQGPGSLDILIDLLLKRDPVVAHKLCCGFLMDLLDALKGGGSDKVFPLLEAVAAYEHPAIRALAPRILEKSYSNFQNSVDNFVSLIIKMHYLHSAAANASAAELTALIYTDLRDRQLEEVGDCLSSLMNFRFPQTAEKLARVVKKILLNSKSSVPEIFVELVLKLAAAPSMRVQSEAVGLLSLLFNMKDSIRGWNQSTADTVVRLLEDFFAHRRWATQVALIEEIKGVFSAFKSVGKEKTCFALYMETFEDCEEVVLIAAAREITSIRQRLGSDAVSLLLQRAMGTSPFPCRAAASVLFSKAEVLLSEDGEGARLRELDQVKKNLKNVRLLVDNQCLSGVIMGLPTSLKSISFEADATLDEFFKELKDVYLSIAVNQRIEVVKSLRSLAEQAPARLRSESMYALLPLILEDPIWVIRREALTLLFVLREALGGEDFREKLLPICLSWADSPRYFVQQNLVVFVARYHMGIGDVLEVLCDKLILMLEKIPIIGSAAYFALSEALQSVNRTDLRKKIEERIGNMTDLKKGKPFEFYPQKTIPKIPIKDFRVIQGL